ncbi:MAG TPA: AMIN domain-containing protein [Gemmatimonadaceae bacterium]|jgi:type IV pilus assembly protein PilQ
MISTRTLASATIVAISAFSGRPAAATPAARMTTVREEGAVTALSVVPNERTTDVVIHVSGSITFNHFTLSKPDKIVVDVNGATLGLPTTDAYDGVARGAIKGVRYSQFTKSVVRIVVTLDSPHSYGVLQNKGELRIQVDGAGDKFVAWNLGSAAEQPSVDPVADAIVTQAKLRAPAPVAAQRPSTPAPRASQSQEPRITINWEKADINEVLGIFASYTNRTILPSRAVQGSISANIVNLPWDVALKEVMNANGYDVTVNGDGVIVIDTFENIAARQATIPLQTRTVRLNYARAGAVAPMVQVRLTHSCTGGSQQSVQAPAAVSSMPQPGGAMTTPAQPAGNTIGSPQPVSTINTVQNLACSQRGAVMADTITNSVAVTDVPSALDELEHYARSLDVRQPQVNIKAKIILVDRTTLEGLGLRYDLGTQQQFFNDVVPRLDSAGRPLTSAGQILLGGNAVSAIANASARVPSAALQLVFSTAMGNYDFTTFLEALQTNTLLDVQAEPSATVLNNRTANLTAGTEVPIRVIDAGASTTGTTSSLPRATVQFRQTGVILQVIPQITNNRQVQMKVHVENSSVQFQTSDVGAVFPKQSVDNEMLVADGETMVVGGLTQTEVNLTKTGLPVLVDLPIIGRLFGVTNRTETKRDLLILITPHIIDEGTTPDSGRP